MRPECQQVINAAAGRELSAAELEALEGSITGSLRELARQDKGRFMGMSPRDRMVEAAKLAKDKILADVVRSHEAAVTEASRKAALFNDVASVKPGLSGQVNYLKGKIVAIENRVDAMSANFFRLVEGTHEAAGGHLFGLFQDPARSADIAAALFGEQSTPEAARAAKSLQGMMDNLVERCQRAGIPLNAREDYRTPQPQDPTKVATAGADAWVEDHLNWVDPGQYVKADGTLMDREELRAMLRESYRSIATDGANKRAEAEGIGGSSEIGSRANSPRQLFFKDSAAWSQAMEKYGRTTNLYELVSSHVRGMAKDITMAEEFGRNAEGNFQQVAARAYEADLNALGGQDIGKLNSLHTKTQRIYDAMMHPDRPGNEYWANLGIQVRGLLASSQLGSLFGALPDLAGMKMASEHNGLPGIRMFRNFMDGLVAGPEKEDFLHKLGIWQDGFQHASNRMAADEFKSGWGTWLNELTHRAMGLNAFDRGMRTGMGRVVMDTLGSFTRKFSSLAEAEGEARLLQSRGITEDHWNVWKAAEVDKGRGNETLLTPDAIYKIPDAAMDPLVEGRVAGRSEIFKAEIEKRNAQTAEEAQWLASRAERIQAAKDKAQAFMEELKGRRADKVGTAAELENVRGLVLANMLRQLEANHDFLAAHATEAAHSRTVDLLNLAQDGAHIEGQPAPATRPGVEQGQKAGTAKPGLEDKAGATLQDYGRAINQGGEGLGRTRAEVLANIKDGQARIAELEKSLDLKSDAREKANAMKFRDAVKDLETYSKELQDRANIRQEYTDAFQSKLGDVLAEERLRMRDEAAEKLLEVTYGQMQFGARGASRSSIEDRLAMGLESSRTAGTPMGELHRFALQFKSVPLGIFRTHLEQMRNLDTIGSKAAYGARFVAYSTLTGALAVEIKAIINGQNPRNMSWDTEEGRKFWMEALASGGGFGLYGDLFANGQTKYGSGAEVLAGPGISAGFNALKEISAARDEVMNGETKHPFALSSVRWVRKNALPLANLWYVKAAFNRLVYDQMQDTLAPGSSAKQQQRMMERGASYWWAPGTTAPQSAPDLGKALP